MAKENKIDFRANNINLELEKGQKLVVTHQGSAWYYEIEVDNYDDLNLRRKSSYRTPNNLKPKTALDK